MPISISSEVLGTLSVTVAETTGTLEVAVLATAPAVLSVELGTPGPAATVAVGTTTTLASGLNATVTNSGTALAAVLNFGIPQGIQGIQGPAGANGATGTAATITVGTTTTLTPGSSATVTNSGTSSAAVFDFGIPSGSTIQVQAQVRNVTGATLPKGTVVYINGGVGNKVTVTKAIATSDATSAQTFGILITDIANNHNGYACVMGLLENLDTSAYTEGQQLYLSPTTAGAWTTTKPSAPNHMVYIGIVERVHANQGTVQVRIQNGYELEELHNVAIASVANGDLLVYETATSLWKNKSAATAGLLTTSVAASTYQTLAGMSAYAPLASPTFTGDPKAPTPATGDNDTSIATTAFVKAQGYATLASPTFTGDPKAPTPATSDNDTSIATTAFVKAQSYVTNSALGDILSTYAQLNGSSAFSVYSNTIRSINSTDGFAALDQGVLNFGNLGSGASGLFIDGSGITFADSTVQTTAAVAGVPEAPIDGTTYGRLNGTWTAVGGSGLGTLTYSSPYIYDTATSSNINSLDLSSGTLTCGQVIAGNGMVDSSGLTLTASSGAVITFADATTQSTAPHDLPIGGTTGQVLTKNSATNYDASWATASGGGGGVDIQTFSTAGTTTWTKPAGAKWVVGYMFGAGGGGGSGAKAATTAIRSGGAGGAGGGLLKFSVEASLLSATESVVIGAGGLGGASRTTDSTAGVAGSQGGTTSFAGRYRAYYAVAGSAGSLTGTANGAGGSAAGDDGVCFQISAVNPGGNGATGIGGNASFNYIGYYAPSGGGGGAGQAATSTIARTGGNGGTKTNASGSGQVGMVATIAGGAGGTTAGVSPTNGAAGSIAYGGGTGGGGGAYITGVAGMNGSNGGSFGGGGGGGSAADNGTAGSGAGGNGGDGALILITYY